jgi:hypothetical protein
MSIFPSMRDDEERCSKTSFYYRYGSFRLEITITTALRFISPPTSMPRHSVIVIFSSNT